MSQCNTQPVGGCMLQSMAVWRSQQRLSYNIQYLGEILQGPIQKLRASGLTRLGLLSHCSWSLVVSWEVGSCRGRALVFQMLILHSEARSGMHSH
jgi:hypothetical protein